MEPESSLPHSRVPTTCPYPEPARSSPYPHIPLPEDPSYPPIYAWVSPVVFPSLFTTECNIPIKLKKVTNFYIYVYMNFFSLLWCEEPLEVCPSILDTPSTWFNMVHSCQQKSIGLKFSKSQTRSDVLYSCHHNSSRFTFPIFAHSCRFSVLHSLQSITPLIY